jgi:NADPH2:quinone reductase
VLRYEDAPEPVPQAGQVVVKIEATGVNFIDIYHRSGQYKGQLPITPGMEGAGVVVALGEGVTEVSVGDRVAYPMVMGSYAEYVAVPAARLAPVPDHVTAAEAAAAMVQGLTAHYLTNSTYPLQEGDIALVHAAAGGTGGLVVQMAKKRGASVIGTVSTPEKAEIALAAGADAVIMYTEQDFEEETRRLTQGQGVHVVYDSVGKTTFDKSLNCLRPRGMMVLFGQSSGAVDPFDPQRLNARGSLFLTRPSLSHYTLTRDEIIARAEDIFGWIGDKTLDLRIDGTFALADVADAHRYLESRAAKGKIVLIP